MGPISVENKLQVDEKNNKSEKFEKLSNLYNFLNFMVIRYKITASVNFFSFDT